MALTQTQVSQLYVSVFGRASEGEGNTYWQTDQPDMVTTANVMLDTDAAKDYFGTTLDDDQAFIEHIYLNTLGKTYAEDTEGVDYWVSELAGGKSKGEVITALINAAQATENAGNAQDQFNNKVAVSDYTADTLSTFTTIEDFTAFIADVDETDASVTTAKAAVDDAVPPVDGETFTLTAAADDFTGTAGDDTFIGTIVQLDQTGGLAESFTSIDSIDGGAGDDILKVTTDSTTQVAAAISDVETIQYRAFSNQTFDMSNVSGVDTFVNNGSVAALTVTAASDLMGIELNNLTGKTTDVTFLSTATAGLEDDLKVSLDGVKSLATTNSKLTLNDGNIETITIDSTGATANRLELDDVSKTEHLVVTGDQNVRLAFTGTNVLNLKSVDASEATGDVRVDIATNVTALDDKLAVVTGSGDDRVDTKLLAKDQTYDLGEGENTFGVALSESVTAAVSVANANKLVLSTAGSFTLNTEKITGVTEVDLSNGGDTITLQKLADTATTLNYTADNDRTTADLALDGINFQPADVTGTTDELTINFTHKNADDIEVARNEGVQTDVTSFTANGIETININSAYMGADDPDTAGVQGGVEFASFAADALKTLTISSDTLVDIDATALANTVKTVDASSTTGGVSINALGVADTGATSTSTVTITLGSGDDVLTNVSSQAKMTVNTTGGSNTVSLDGTTGDGSFNNTLTINAGSGKDNIDLSNLEAASGVAGNDDGLITIKFADDDAVDTLTLDGAADKIGATTGVVTTGFEAGTGGDKIAFGTSAAVDGGAAGAVVVYEYAEITSTGGVNTNYTFADGMTVLDLNGLNPTALDAATVKTWMQDVDGAGAGTAEFVFNNAADVVYFAVSNGSDTGIYMAAAGADTDMANATITQMITLTGVADAGDLTTDNFVNFL